MEKCKIEQLVELAKTMRTNEVAKIFGVSPSLVRYYAAGGKDGKYRKKLAKEDEYPSLEKMVGYIDYPTKEDSIEAISKEFKITKPLARKWLRRTYEKCIIFHQEDDYELAIRKLTPRECFALMDFNEGAYERASKVNSSNQLYKQAGNAIVKNCLVAIIGQLYPGCESKYKEVKPPNYYYNDSEVPPISRDFDYIQYALPDGRYRIEKNVALIELFGGIGTQAMAFETLKVPFTHHRLVEFDKFPVASYNAIHGTSFVPTDICNVHIGDLGIEDKKSNHYFLTYSFPCQNLSVAGKMEGMSRKDWKEGNSTRSGLLWEVERILIEGYEKGVSEGSSTKYLPDTLLMENVTQVHSSKNLEDWKYWLAFLSSIGYKSVYKDMNAKDYGVPQNRNRTFCISYLESDKEYEFPKKIELETCLEDYLEEEDKVGEKYYINTPSATELTDSLQEKYGDGVGKEFFGD